MSDASGNGHYVQCPLCEGQGRMKRSELAARLTACRQELVKEYDERQSGPNAAENEATDFKQEVLKGPVTRILWRRSPKE